MSVAFSQLLTAGALYSFGANPGFGILTTVLSYPQRYLPAFKKEKTGRIPMTLSYEEKAIHHLKRLRDDNAISATNLSYFEDYLLAYHVSDARKVIFFEKLRPILQRFPDIKIVTQTKVNQWCSELRGKYAPATVTTFTKVFCQFARWLNDGNLPSALRDIAKSKRSESLRRLTPEDMLSWDNGLQMAKFSPSPQIQAIVTGQLDGGFRPSEFESLNYGDVSLIDSMFVFHVRSGKTGSRNVVLFRATPYLKQWMDTHPTRNPNDPLWIDELQFTKTGKAVRYRYTAMAKRVKTLGKQALIKKPLDFYNLRHSSCALDKKDNLPAELAAERHGHSIKYYIEVYGRLDVRDTVNRYKTHFGMESGAVVNPMQKYAIQPHIIKPASHEGEAFAQQYAMEQRIQQMQSQLDMMKQQHPSHPAPNMYSAIASPYPPCGTHQAMQSSKSSHL